ncbi:MAG: LacI family transcriptional regulator [Lachnospiraceae bacterium]|nr:LacI family transcriptional regulator [Lachnospiraceae bacterium]
MQKVTIKDVAREAGVAISTVSNAMNNSNLVNEETRAKILEVAEKLDYVPNINGRMLKTKKSDELLFLTSSIQGDYFTTLLSAMSQQCDDFGYTLNVVITRKDEVIRNRILGKRYDGIFVFLGEWFDAADMQLLEKNHIRTVFLDRACSSEYVGSVVFDSHRMGYQVTESLIHLGHKKIAFIEGPADVYDGIQRKQGYLDAMKEYGLSVPQEYLLEGRFEELYTYNSVSSFLRFRNVEMPDAFIAGNDLSAVGCVNALTDAGYQIPRNLSVVGFDDIPIAKYMTPKLTTVKNPISQQGIVAVKMLEEIIKEKRNGYVESLAGELVVRESLGIVMNDR